MKIIRAIAVSILLISGFVQSVPAGEKTISLQSGMQITLEPNSRLSSVYIGVLIDRSAYSFSIDTLLYFEAIAQRIQQILSEVIPGTVLYLPESFSEHPYNWMEQSYIYASLSSDLFYIKAQQIIQIFRDLDKELNFPYSNINVPANNNIIGNGRERKQSIILSRSDLEQFITDKNPFNLFRICFYGNFDPLVVLRGLDENISPQPHSNKGKTLAGYVVFKASVERGKKWVKLKLPATTPEQYLALEYLTDFILKDVGERQKKINVKIRLPWSLHEQTFSIDVPHALNWQTLGARLEATKPQDIRYWYYKHYRNKIRLIAINPESYMFYNQLSALYFGDAGRMFRLWLPETFPSNHIAAMVKEIGKTLNRGDMPK